MTQGDPQDGESAVSHDGPNTSATPDVSSIRIPESAPRPAAKEEKNKTPLIIGGSVLGGVAVSAGAFGISRAFSNNTPAPQTQPTSITQEDQGAAVVGSGQEATTPSPTSLPGEQLGNNANILVQTTTVEAMDAMTPQQYADAHLSIADRAAYTLSKLGPKLSSGMTLGIVEPSKDIAASDPSAIPALYWNTVQSVARSESDRALAAKTESVMFYSTNNDQGRFQNMLNQVEANGKLSTHFVYVDSGKLQSGFDASGNPIEFINITFNTSSISTGVVENTQTTQAIRSVIRTQDGKEYVVYSAGYTAEGKTSPDPKYSY